MADEQTEKKFPLSMTLSPMERAALKGAGLDPEEHMTLQMDPPVAVQVGQTPEGHLVLGLQLLIPAGTLRAAGSRLVVPGAPPPTPLDGMVPMPPDVRIVIRTEALTDGARQQMEAELREQNLALVMQGASVVVASGEGEDAV